VNATMKIVSGGITRQTTGGSPTYSFTDLPPGTYTVTATDSRGAYGATASAIVTLTAGSVVTQNLTFPPVGKVEVTVTINGSPVQSARIHWRRDTAAPDAWNWEGYTDALGRFTINNVSGSVVVRARHPSHDESFGLANAAITAEAQVVPVSISVPGLATISGVVRSRDGVVYGGAAVKVLRASDGLEFKSATANATTGAFQLTDVPVGPILLRAEKTEWVAGYGQHDLGEVTGTPTAHGTTLTLDALVSRGTVTIAGQRELWQMVSAVGAEVTLSVMGVANGSAAALADPYLEVFAPNGTLAASNDNRTATDKNPLVTFTPAVAGPYVVSIRAAGTETGGYRLAWVGSTGPAFRVYAGATVEGTLTHQAGGAAVNGGTVRLTYSGGPTGVPSGTATVLTDANGIYRFTSVPVGATATVAVLDAAGTVLSSVTGTTGGAGEVLVLNLTQPSLGTVEVHAARNGTSFPNLSVTITSDNPHATAALRTRTATTNSSGLATFTGVPAGVIEVDAIDPASGLPVETTGTLVNGAILPLELTLPALSDSTPPAAVSNLAASSTTVGSVTVTWTAPGDDGTTGTASAYDLRYSGAPITAANFLSATPVTVAAPGAAGTGQTANLTLTGGETYYVALKTRDEAYNWSELSNVASVTVTGIATNGLKLWLRADAGLTFATGNYVSAWADQSGNSNHATQNTASAQPLRVEGEANGKPVLRFDGSDHVLFPRQTTIRTVFWVVKEQAGSSDAWRYLLGDVTGYPFSSGSAHQIWSSTYTHSNVLSGETRLNGAVINGVTTNRPTALSLISVVTANNVSADVFSDRTYRWMGDLAELVIYDRPLADVERRQVEEYLAAKYGLFTPAAAAPAFSPAGGRFTGSVEVSVTAGPAASIRYTTDGSEPTESSSLYTEPLLLTATTTVKARAYQDGRTPSPVATVTFLENAQLLPNDIAGLKLWLRADADAGTAGDSVAQWTDQSGQANHLTQSTLGARPQLVPSPTGLPVLRFDGVNDGFLFTTRISTIRTVFWVLRETPGAAGDSYRSLLGDSSSYHFIGGAQRQIWDAGYASSYIRNGQTRVNGTVVNGTTTNKPTSLSVVSLVTTGAVQANLFTQDQGIAARGWLGDIAEVLIYDTALSDTDRQAIEQYLATRHGITLP
jgi:hypothetical protein